MIRGTTINRQVRVGVAAPFDLLLSAVPSFADHPARLSGDLANHLAKGSQFIDVAHVDALAARCNLVVKRRMKSAAPCYG